MKALVDYCLWTDCSGGVHIIPTMFVGSSGRGDTIPIALGRGQVIALTFCTAIICTLRISYLCL